VELQAAGTRWAIATPHTVATEAGAVAFERGGNAVDAALVAAVTLAVSYPHNCGVGGDLFALVQRPDGATIAINASGRAPAGVDPDTLRARYGNAMPEEGPDSITVPGAVSGWDTLHREGARLPWADAFGPAIALAYGGVAVSRSLSRALQERQALLAADPGMADVFFADGGAPLPRGELFRQPALGATLQRLATEGASALYAGSIGERYVAGLRATGTPIGLHDLAAHSADVVAPLSGRYRDLDVRVVPPNSQGFALLEMLELAERLGIDPDPLGPDAGVLALAFAAANRDRDHHLADPDAMRVHPSTLLDDGHLAGLADRIRDATPPAAVPGHRHGTGDTIAMVTADADGWAVSLIQSLWDSFGSGILEPETGIVAHDRGGCFTLEPGHPNEIAPGKRPFHTLMPVLVHREGRLAAVAGSMGGASQPQINAQNLIRAFDLRMGAGETIAAPRWTVWGEPGEGVVRTEASVPEATAARFEEAGFGIERLQGLDEALGHAHVILSRPDGSFDVGSDPRADGGALAL
jgi:gamma-glutamyltranspeptidase